MAPKKSTDVLRSPKIVRAEEVLRSDDVPPIVLEAHMALRSEIAALRMSKVSEKSKPAPDDRSTHPAVTGLSVGGAKEVIDYFLMLASAQDPFAQDLLGMSFVDGGITAIIATVAAWLAKPGKK